MNDNSNSLGESHGIKKRSLQKVEEVKDEKYEKIGYNNNKHSMMLRNFIDELDLDSPEGCREFAKEVEKVHSRLEEPIEEKKERGDSTYVKFRIDIIDTGIGIQKENLKKLFMNFGKLDEHSKMNHSGTGLGLSICKRMIE